MFYYWDLIGTFIFCVSGVLAGRQLKMDYLGLFLMGLITGTGGGTLRSMMLADAPPGIFRSPDYMITAAIAVPVAVYFGSILVRFSRLVSIVDALGLGIFACVGARIGMESGLAWWGAIGMGMVSATFGGVIRDVIRNEVPLIFRKEIYGSAALLGAALVLGFDHLGVDPNISLSSAALATAVVRLLAIRYAINASEH